MTALTWSEALALQQPRMDQTHREFIELLQLLEQSIGLDAATLDERFVALLEHTEAHFAQEDRWIAAIGFAPQNCHSFQHAHVLKVLREVQQIVHRDGDGQVVRQIVDELAQWFTGHAQSMDAALAQTMIERGYDPETGTLRHPIAADAAPITGCGGASCS